MTYEIFKRDSHNHTHLIEQGGVEFFASRGLLTELEEGDDILAAELVDNAHRLTIRGESRDGFLPDNARMILTDAKLEKLVAKSKEAKCEYYLEHRDKRLEY